MRSIERSTPPSPRNCAEARAICARGCSRGSRSLSTTGRPGGRLVLRPALLPAAGAVLILVGVTVSWWRVDDQLGRIGSGRYLADARLASRSPASGTVARGGSSAADVRIPAGAPATSASPAASREPQAAGRRPPVGTRGGDRVFAASLLEMDALSRPKGIAAAGTVTADEDEPESFLPGAVGGNLGDPIRPIPRPRPIVIPPLVAAPIVVAPIVDAPPVSTLATPASTLTRSTRVPGIRQVPASPEESVHEPSNRLDPRARVRRRLVHRRGAARRPDAAPRAGVAADGEGGHPSAGRAGDDTRGGERAIVGAICDRADPGRCRAARHSRCAGCRQLAAGRHGGHSAAGAASRGSAPDAANPAAGLAPPQKPMSDYEAANVKVEVDHHLPGGQREAGASAWPP